jgi:hypothetical protein
MILMRLKMENGKCEVMGCNSSSRGLRFRSLVLVFALHFINLV